VTGGAVMLLSVKRNRGEKTQQTAYHGTKKNKKHPQYISFKEY
jgi:hypothetical protein